MVASGAMAATTREVGGEPASGAAEDALTARRRSWLAALAAALVAFLPFARGVLSGDVLYFRDLSILFHPFRRYVVEGLRRGEIRFWDPYVHEGVPLVYPPIAYPLDLLQALWPDERGVSTLLALHVPLAAAAFVVLARRLGAGPMAAAAGGIVYALGGFTLSTVNLYVYAQAVAWAPLVVATLLDASDGPARRVAPAALASGLLFSTMGIEIAAQAVAVGLVLAASSGREPGRPTRARERATAFGRAVLAVVLGAGLAGPVFLVMRANMAAGERARGFAVDVVLNQSVHPFTMVQTLVSNLYGDLARLPDRWWGSNFFDRGFPYILSLYLGASVLALALAGTRSAGRRAWPWLALAAAALVVSLGRWGGLGLLAEAVPGSWRVLRYPTKAFFTVHLAVAVLAAFGVDALARSPAAARRAAAALLALGAPLAALPLAPAVLPSATAWFLAHFFPPALGPSARAGDLVEILRSGAAGGALALAAAAVAWLRAHGRVEPRLAVGLVAAIAATDLLRAGAGLNPMAQRAAFETSAEVLDAVQRLGVRRVFTCNVEASPAYWNLRRQRSSDHERLTFAASRDTLTPHYNRTARVESALGPDLTSLVPAERVLPAGLGCGDPAALLPWLRRAGVSHVVSLDELLDTPGLSLVGEVAPTRIAPLRVRFYSVRDAPPLRYLAAAVRRGMPPPEAVPGPDGTAWIEDAPEEVTGASGSVRPVVEGADALSFDVEASRPTALVLLDGQFPGWRAAVDGRPAPVLTAGHHRAVWVPGGRSRVELSYHPRGWRGGLAWSLLSAALLAVLLTRDRNRG